MNDLRHVTAASKDSNERRCGGVAQTRERMSDLRAEAPASAGVHALHSA